MTLRQRSGVLLFFVSALCMGTAHAQVSPEGSRILLAGDVLQADYGSAPDHEERATLHADGYADFGYAGRVRLVGLTLNQAREAMVEAVRHHIANPDVVLTVVERRYILHVGDTIEMHYPFSAENNQTVTIEPDGHATLYLAGDIKLAGLTLADARAEILTAVSRTLRHPQFDLVLKDFQKPYIVVGGEVISPGKFEMREDITALQALELAGGPKSTASKSRIVLLRHLNDSSLREVSVLDLSHMKKNADLKRDVMLEPGDMLYVTTSRTADVETLIRTLNLGVFFDPAQDF